MGEYESEAFGSIQYSLKKSRAFVRESSEKRGRSSPESKGIIGSYLQERIEKIQRLQDKTVQQSDLRENPTNHQQLNIIECETASYIKTTPRFEKTQLSAGKYELYDPEEENIMDTSDEPHEQDL